jgi:predicted TIM-barrel fold metal-dependent hydrolase
LIIDSHVYCLPPELRDSDLKLAASEKLIHSAIYQHPEGPDSLMLSSPESILKSMQENHIDISLLIPFPWSTPQLCEKNNEYLNQLARHHPEFLWVFSLQPQDSKWQEIAEKYVQKGAVGIKVNPAWQGFELDGSEMSRLAKWVTDKNIFIMVHVDHPFKKSPASPAHLYSFVKRHPKIKILACHMGGLLGLYALHKPVAKVINNIWFDTAISSTLPMIQWHLEAGLKNRIIFGSDYPFNHSHSQLQVINGIRKLKLTAECEKAIFETNFFKLVGDINIKRKSGSQ